MQIAIEQNLVPKPTPADSPLQPPLQLWKVYAMAAIYLIAGLAIVYLLHMSQSPATPAGAVSVTKAPHPMPSAPANVKPPTLDEMKHAADSQATLLLQKLKSDPNNIMLLMQLGSVYHASHQFKEAAAYYGKAVQADPKNAAARTKLAISLYREGDVDAAIAQLNRTLQDSPGDAAALFNLGMIRLEGKQDGPGALSAWQQLLKLNPQLSADRKAEVQDLMAQVQTSLGRQKAQPRSGNQ
jgi:cytochrome c-type biogenesis protein CcmH/NrfG